VNPSLEGMNAIVIGRSNLVGRPLVQLLLNENVTVTIAHSRSRHLEQLCAQADLVYAAVGKPEMVRGDWIKPGATVIDVGINRGDDGLVGDVDFAAAVEVLDVVVTCRAKGRSVEMSIVMLNEVSNRARHAGASYDRSAAG